LKTGAIYLALNIPSKITDNVEESGKIKKAMLALLLSLQL